MKKLFKYLGIFVALLAIIVALALTTIYFRGIPSYKTEKTDLKVEITPARVERGRKLAEMLCVKCHLDPKTNQLTGKYLDDLPAEFGEIYSRNITRHPVKGIGSWTDGQIAYLIRTGIKPDGGYLPPYMVKLAHISDEDLQSIIAFLRSDDPRMAASEVSNIESKPSLLTKALCYFAFKPYPMPKEKIMPPDTNNRVVWGKYLVTGALECYQCHSADFKTNDAMVPENSKGFCAGGNKMLNHEREIVPTANITPDQQTGIGSWSEQEFINTLRYGKTPRNTSVRYPMEPYTQLSENELSAIYAYLRTIPAIQNKVAGSL